MSQPLLDIVGLGVSTLDFLTLVDEFPSREGVQRAHDCVLQGGGPVATALVTAARLGVRTAMIDRLTNDWRGRQIQADFGAAGVSEEGFLFSEGESPVASGRD